MTENDSVRRLLDLAERCYEKNQYTFSGFLSAGDLSLFHEQERDFSFVDRTVSGGGVDNERCMIRFGSVEQLGYEEDFPICCLIVEPLIRKFSDELTHRDFLGALMNLGIERDVLGDIIVKDRVGYIFCEDHMGQYLLEHLDKVKHTSVKCHLQKECPIEAAPEFLREEHIVSSNRADAVIAKAYKLSRSQSIDLFREKKIFVNSRQYENNSGVLKDGDIISVRGYGKFRFLGFLAETKKGRIRVALEKYV